MKKSMAFFAFLFTIVFSASLLTMNCGGKKSDQTQEEGHHHEADSTDNHDTKTDSTQVVYACPMHPEITGKDGDKCSKCGMTLELLKEHKDDHAH